MVILDSPQHVKECTSWREQLRSSKNEMAQLTEQLQQTAINQHNKDFLKEVEHFQNQFYIQQINIHDLKQAIKLHEHKLQLETAANGVNPAKETINTHEELYNKYKNLEHTIQGLKTDFESFLNKF
jgi:hypothetical protein